MTAAVVLSSLAACGQSSNAICTPDPNRSSIECAPTSAGVGCLGRDLGYADDNLYATSCTAPKQGDASSCAALYVCTVNGTTAHWEPDVGF